MLNLLLPNVPIRNQSDPNLLTKKVIKHRKNYSEIKLPQLNAAKSIFALATANPQTSVMAYKNQSYQKYIDDFKQHLKQLLKLKKHVKNENNMFLKRRILEDIKYMPNGKIVLRFWEQLEQIIRYNYLKMRMYQRQHKTFINKDIVISIDKAIKICKKRIGQHKQKSWTKVSEDVGYDRKKLKTQIQKVGMNIGKIQDRNQRQQIIKGVKQMNGQILAAKFMYTEWRQRALKFLTQGNIKCQILKAQLDTQCERKF